MKEYKVQEFQYGGWADCHDPCYGGTIIHKDLRAAVVCMNQMKLTNKNTDFRVVSREVSEWTEEK